MSAKNLSGVHNHVRIEEHPDERAITLWVKWLHYKGSTQEMRVLAQHILLSADTVDTEANRKRRFLDESDYPQTASIEAVTPPKDDPPAAA